MLNRFICLFLIIVITLTFSNPAVLQASRAEHATLQTGGATLTAGDTSGVGGFSSSAESQLFSQALLAPGPLTRGDYQALYSEAGTLLQRGVIFRTTEIQNPLPGGGYGSVITNVLLNYRDFNQGALFYKFCANYDQINVQGYCPGANDIRNQLLRALQLFAVLTVADPPNLTLTTPTGERPVREVGRESVMTTLREVVYDHLIFGNEFMVDALDYRVSDNSMNADAIINQELQQLTWAVQQFDLAVAILVHALNADIGGPQKSYMADFFTASDFALFGAVSDRLVTAIDQLAFRYRQRGEDATALTLYQQAATTQHTHAIALATKARERGVDFLQNGGWQIMNNLNQLHANAQRIQDGLNAFGFTDQYVPLHSFARLYDDTKNQFLADAISDEALARNAQREFDQNRTALNNELQNLRTAYHTQLIEMCGAPADDFVTCEGGLMQQNYLAMVTAGDQIRLVSQRLANIPAQMEIEQTRASRSISITVAGGQALSALSYAIGVRNAYREVTTVSKISSEGWYRGVETSFSFSIGINGIGFSFGGPRAGYQHSQTKTTTVARIWDPSQEELGRLAGLRDVQGAATSAQIIGANSEAVIRSLLLQQAELLIELDLAYDRWNQLSAEHNHLVEKYHNLLGLRVQAQANLLDSYLNNPAYRIFRETLTLEAARSHELAAQFAYLTAKALEYEYLAPIPFLREIFKARTANDINNFLLRLKQWETALGNPGYRNRLPYRISLAQDLLGLSDRNLDPTNVLTPGQRTQRRYELFQEVLRQNTYTNTLKLNFTTSILNRDLFSPNVWNQRIAGVNLPADVPNTQGVALNLLTRQFGDLGTPEVILKHGGQASYRTATNQVIQYTPGATRLVGYPVPAGFTNASTSAVIQASVNGNNRGQPTSALYNLSIAASNWVLTIDLTSPLNRNLDLSQLEDIEIIMDTTGIALGGQRALVEAEAAALQAEAAPTQQ
jgi:hypothetical protein